METFRGTGRTWRQMEALPDGSVFIVSQRVERDRCQGDLTKMGRRSNALRILTLDDIRDGRLRGLSNRLIEIDHEASDRINVDPAMLAEITPYLERSGEIRQWLDEAAELTPQAIDAVRTFAGLRVLEDAAIPADEVHFVCRDYNGRTGLTDITRHRLIKTK